MRCEELFRLYPQIDREHYRLIHVFWDDIRSNPSYLGWYESSWFDLVMSLIQSMSTQQQESTFCCQSLDFDGTRQRTESSELPAAPAHRTL